jgi:RNA polymerase-binding transcription factor DksA
MKTTPPMETREQLLQKRVELQERLAAIRRDYANALDRNMDEQSLQLENAEVLEELSREAVEELEEIERKLRQFTSPRY